MALHSFEALRARAPAACAQVGIMLCGLVIEGTVVGGPAFNTNQLARGDVIVRVDGTPATQDNVEALLVGCDVPGTSVVIAVRKGGPQARHQWAQGCLDA